MIELETYYLESDGISFPNSALPVLVYRCALRADAPVMERTFAENDWSNAWRNGIYAYHHFHSIAHEVLGIAEGEVRVTFGGPDGHTVAVRGGDVVVIPAGVAHCNAGQSDDLLVVGAYPCGGDWDLRRGRTPRVRGREAGCGGCLAVRFRSAGARRLPERPLGKDD